MSKISVCLATFNEEKNIKDCLESVKWADEIIIVDGSSTDKTVAMAKKYTDKIIIRENPLMFHINKQKAFETATGDWILYLDADERVSPALKKEIISSVKRPRPRLPDLVSTRSRTGRLAEGGQASSVNGFWIPRKNIIFGRWIRNSFWYPDHQLRLFRRGKAFLPCKSLHEQPKLSGKAGYLKNPLVHYNYRTVSQYVKGINDLYSENDARVFLAKKKKLHWHDAIRFPVQDFLSTFFARQAYKDGLHGLVLSLLQAFSAFVTFAKVWEAQGFKEVKEEKFLEKAEREFKQAIKEFRYWFLTSWIKEEPNLIKGAVLKIKRRLKIL